MNILGFAVGLSTWTKGSTTVAVKAPYTYQIYDHCPSSVFFSESVNTHIVVMDIQPSYRFWFSCHIYFTGDSWTSRPIIRFKGTDGEDRLRVVSKTDESLDLQVFDGTAWNSTSLVSDVIRLHSQFTRIDVELSDDAVRLYLNGTLYSELVGEIPEFDLPVNEVAFFSPDNNTAYSACFVADEDTRSVTMVQHGLASDGTYHSDFDGVYSDVDYPSSLDGNGAVSTEVAGATHTFGVEDLASPFTSGYGMVAVGVYARAATDDSGIVGSITTVASDGTNTTESADIPMNNIMQPRIGILYTAPDGTAWDTDKFNAAEFGLRTKA